jgi:oxygen-independent coproporphyrinogen-3 oxidase
MSLQVQRLRILSAQSVEFAGFALPVTDNNAGMPLGIYLSVPFCKSKCSYCNFATGVVSRAAYSKYVDRLCADMAVAETTAASVGGKFERELDSVFLGGGTPTILDPVDLQRLFQALRQNFELSPASEITVECAPGTLTSAMLEVFVGCGVNRVSLGVQSWVDSEAAAVGRLHTRDRVLQDIAALRAAGIQDINVDLIAGLPHQTAESWAYSVAETLACGVPHASVYMLEVDEDSRLGRELMAGGAKYHAHFVPEEDLSAEFYGAACERLEAAGIRQYEISNFASPGAESRHNLKYWERKPYFGFGVDAHSMLPAVRSDLAAIRFAGVDDLNSFVAGAPLVVTEIPLEAALEEAFFLGLRLNRGVNLRAMEQEFGAEPVAAVAGAIRELVEYGLLERDRDQVRLTAQGRLLSNEVFEKFLGVAASPSPRA